MLLAIMLVLAAMVFLGVGNTFKTLFVIGTLAIVSSALYVAGYMLIVMAVNA